MSHYSPNRIENISRIMPTYCAFIKSGDEVELGLKGDPLYPVAYRNSRPRGVVKSVFGPKGAQVVNVQLNDKFGGKMAHCDVRTLNPYLLFEPVETSYQRALERADKNPDMQQYLKKEFEENEVAFRGVQSQQKSSFENDDEMNKRIAQLESNTENIKKTMMRAIQGLATDINAKHGSSEATYAGRLLQMMNKDDDDDDEIDFRGVDDDDDDDEDEEASDGDDAEFY